MTIIDKIVEQNLGVYTAAPTRLQEDVSQEAQVASDYRGRLAYELLQNADDAMEDGASVQDVVRFVLTEDALWMANNGRPLSDDDIQGLCGLGASSKVLAQGERRASIGHKGLGFKSVLEITDRPAAMSERIAFELAEDHARHHVSTLFAGEGQQVPARFPTMRFPALIDNPGDLWTELRAAGFKTAFRFPFRDDLSVEQRAHLATVLLELPLTTVLFLKHLDLVEVHVDLPNLTERRDWTIVREERKDESWIQQAGMIGSGLYRVGVAPSHGSEASFLVAHDADVRVEEHRTGLSGPAWEGVTTTEVSVAVLEPEVGVSTMPAEWRHFHVFLPTAEPIPYPILVNGAFTTDLSRQSVAVREDPGDYNSYLVKQAARLFCDSLLPELKHVGLEYVLDVLERDDDIAEGEAAHLFHEALSDRIGSVPLLPGEDDNELTLGQSVFPPQSLGDDGSLYRSILTEDAKWEGKTFPRPEFCTGRWASVAASMSAQVLNGAEALACLAENVDPVRSASYPHESHRFDIDPVLEVASAIYESAPFSERDLLERAAQEQPLFPTHRNDQGSFERVAVDSGVAFYPPLSARVDIPLQGLHFMAHSLCWGSLSRREQAQTLEGRLATWSALFGVREFRFDQVMEAAVLPGLRLRDDGDPDSTHEGLNRIETLAAICQLAGRTPSPERPLRYQRLESSRAFFNLSRLPVPCRSRDGEIEWVPAYKVYFGRDWIGDASVEDLVDTLGEAAEEFAPRFLAPPDLLVGRLGVAADDADDDGEEAEDLDDEVEIGEEDLDGALAEDESQRWIDFLTWIGVNSALRPIHFHDVEDRRSGWITTKGLKQPQGWAFRSLDSLWETYVEKVLQADKRVTSKDVDAYVYQVHDLDGIVTILRAAEQDARGTVGQALLDHLIRHWDYYEQFTEAEVALVERGRYPSQRSKPPRAQSHELMSVGDNLWLYRLRRRGFVPTSQGPRKPSEAWLASPEVERRFGRRGQEAGLMLPLVKLSDGLPPRQVAAVAGRLGIKADLNPSTFTLEDARLLTQRIVDIAGNEPDHNLMRQIIRPAYREMFELLSGHRRNGDTLVGAPLLAVANGRYVSLPATEVFYARTPGYRQRSGIGDTLPYFVLEADTSANAPLVHLFEVKVLEDALTWEPNPGESPLSESEMIKFRDGVTSLLPELLARVRAERRLDQDLHTLEQFLSTVEPVADLEVMCSYNGRPLNTDTARNYYVNKGTTNGPSAFVVWSGEAWPPSPDDGQHLAMALADALEINLVETFLAFVRSDKSQRFRLLEMAGASERLADAQRDINEPLDDSEPPPGFDPPEPTIPEGQNEDEVAPIPSVYIREPAPAAPPVPLVALEDLTIDGEPIVIVGLEHQGSESGRESRSSTTGESRSVPTPRAAPATDLVSLDQLGMSIAIAYEAARLNRLGAPPLILTESEQRGIGDANHIVVDVSAPRAIALAESASVVVRKTMAELERAGVSRVHPGFDVLTIKDGNPERLIELKSSGVDARVQAMSWNEWKSASLSRLRPSFWLYLVGNLRADIPGVPFLRAIHDPFGTLSSDLVSDERVARSIQLRVREFDRAEHLDLGVKRINK